MQIDWLTVAAQIVNFLVLVWLLKHFLYGPVTAAMARREARIADQVESSRAREADAERERERLHERMQRLEQRRDAIFEQAREEADEEKSRLLDEARAEVDATREDWQQQLRDEQDTFLDRLRRDTAEGFAELARRALTDLADETLEARMIETLGTRLAALDDTERDHFRDAGTFTVATTFALDDERRDAITDMLHEHLRDDAKPDFQVSEDLLCGIEVAAGGRRLGWSLADYLADFERQLTERLDAGKDARANDDAADEHPEPETARA
jgi:F-type H+-transporting ATPase subunit b